MAYKHQQIGLLVRADPAKASALIAAAWRENKSEAATARAIGCGRRTLQRWIDALLLKGYQPKVDAQQPEVAQC